MNPPFKTNRMSRILGAAASVCTSILLFVAVVSLSDLHSGTDAEQIARAPAVNVVS